MTEDPIPNRLINFMLDDTPKGDDDGIHNYEDFTILDEDEDDAYAIGTLMSISFSNDEEDSFLFADSKDEIISFDTSNVTAPESDDDDSNNDDGQNQDISIDLLEEEFVAMTINVGKRLATLNIEDSPTPNSSTTATTRTNDSPSPVKENQDQNLAPLEKDASTKNTTATMVGRRLRNKQADVLQEAMTLLKHAFSILLTMKAKYSKIHGGKNYSEHHVDDRRRILSCQQLYIALLQEIKSRQKELRRQKKRHSSMISVKPIPGTGYMAPSQQMIDVVNMLGDIGELALEGDEQAEAEIKPFLCKEERTKTVQRAMTSNGVGLAVLPPAFMVDRGDGKGPVARQTLGVPMLGFID